MRVASYWAKTEVRERKLVVSERRSQVEAKRS
jgi:hypothetical protein